MTRKQALSAAMERIRALEMDETEKTAILKGLQLCADELPFVRWSEAAIFDACDEFLLTHPYIRLKDFDHAGLPSHTVIKRRFGMTAQEFRDKFYPITDVTTKSPYFEHSVAEWNELFRTEFCRIHPRGQDDYNYRRDKALPTWNTVAKMNGVKRWSELLRLLDLKKCPVKPEYKVTVLLE